MARAKKWCTKVFPHVEIYKLEGDDWKDVGYFDYVRGKLRYTDWDGEEA